MGGTVLRELLDLFDGGKAARAGGSVPSGAIRIEMTAAGAQMSARAAVGHQGGG